MSNPPKVKGRAKGLSERAGLVLSAPRVRTVMRQVLPRVGRKAVVAVTALLEKSIETVLQGAYDASQRDKKRTLTPSHIAQAINNPDSELRHLFGAIQMSGAGCLPTGLVLERQGTPKGKARKKVVKNLVKQTAKKTMKKKMIKKKMTKKVVPQPKK